MLNFQNGAYTEEISIDSVIYSLDKELKLIHKETLELKAEITYLVLLGGFNTSHERYVEIQLKVLRLSERFLDCISLKNSLLKVG